MGTHTKTEVTSDLNILQVNDLLNKFPFKLILHFGNLFFFLPSLCHILPNSEAHSGHECEGCEG